MTAQAPAPGWVRLAQPTAARVTLRRPAAGVAFAVLAVVIAWWFPQHPDPYSSRWAGKAAYIALTAPLVATFFVGLATARVLVGTRVIAALYGRATEQGVEMGGVVGRFGWKPSRRRFRPGQVFLEAPVGGLPAVPMYLIMLSQGQTRLVVSADAPWDEGTLPCLVAWLHNHGIQVVALRPPAWPPHGLRPTVS